MSDLEIREAVESDLEAINAIYNHYVLCSTCTYQTEPETPQARRGWFLGHGPGHPVIVAIANGELVGWGSLSPYHARAAYQHTVEDSVYVRHDARRQGVGSKVLDRLVAMACQAGHHAIIAAIDSEQPASISLHARHGFLPVGRLREVGRKYDRWLDVVYMQRLLPRESGHRLPQHHWSP